MTSAGHKTIKLLLAEDNPLVRDLIVKGLDHAIGAKTVTYDFARLMEGAKEVKCGEFASEMIRHMR